MCLHKLFDKHLGKELLGKASIFIYFTVKMKNIFGRGNVLTFSSTFALTWYTIY